MSGLREYLAGENDGPGGTSGTVTGNRGGGSILPGWNRGMRMIFSTYIPNGPLREAALASPYTMAEIACRMGWMNGGHGGDGTRLRRVLGIRPRGRQNNMTYNDDGYQRYVSHETAVKIVRAIDRDPWEFDL